MELQDLILLTDLGVQGPNAPLIPTGQLGLYFRNGNLCMRLSSGAEVTIGGGTGPLKVTGLFASTDPSAVPDPSAIIEGDSTTQGFLMPRMLGVERDAIVSTAQGLMIYDTEDDNVYSLQGGLATAGKDDGALTYAAILPGSIGNTYYLFYDFVLPPGSLPIVTLDSSVIPDKTLHIQVDGNNGNTAQQIADAYNASDAASVVTITVVSPDDLPSFNEGYLSGGLPGWAPLNKNAITDISSGIANTVASNVVGQYANAAQQNFQTDHLFVSGGAPTDANGVIIAHFADNFIHKSFINKLTVSPGNIFTVNDVINTWFQGETFGFAYVELVVTAYVLRNGGQSFPGFPQCATFVRRITMSMMKNATGSSGPGDPTLDIQDVYDFNDTGTRWGTPIDSPVITLVEDLGTGVWTFNVAITNGQNYQYKVTATVYPSFGNQFS